MRVEFRNVKCLSFTAGKISVRICQLLAHWHRTQYKTHPVPLLAPVPRPDPILRHSMWLHWLHVFFLASLPTELSSKAWTSELPQSLAPQASPYTQAG